jgi:hypothetical protein
MDSAYYGAGIIAAIRRAGARFSVTVLVNAIVQTCIVHYADLRVMPTWRRQLQVAA